MTKKILSVFLVLCTMLTFVPFIGSAASVEDGLLILENTRASSGEGWTWENGVLTLDSENELNAVMASVEASVTVTGDVTLDSMLVLSEGGIITTGEYSLTVLGGINGMDVEINNANVIANSIMDSGALVISDSHVVSDCSAFTYTIAVYSEALIIENSIVEATSSYNDDWTSVAILASSATVKNSMVVANGAVWGFYVMNYENTADGVLDVTNSTIYANGKAAAIATSMSYDITATVNTDSIVLNGSTITTPEEAEIVATVYEADYMGASFVGVADSLGNIATSVVIEADDVTLLPDGEMPEVPELPENPDEPENPEDPENPDDPGAGAQEDGVYYEIYDGELILNIVTEPIFDRVGLFYAEDTSTSACLITASEYQEWEGKYIWNITIDAPTEPTEYVVRCRDAATKSYKNGMDFPAFVIDPTVGDDFAPVTEELYIGGVNAFETPEGDGWYFDAESLTLTLDNCTLTQDDAATYIDAYGDPISALIYVRGDLIINLVGENSIEYAVTETPDVRTTYGAIWVDPTYSDYKEELLAIVGEGSLTAGIAVAQDVYESGKVAFSFGVYLYNELGVNLSELGTNSVVDIYGGVVGVPATYDVSALAFAPSYLQGTNVTAYKNIEGTMLDENGYDPINNEAWRLVIEMTSASVDKEGTLNILADGEAEGNGWSWKDGVLTLGDIEGIKFIQFGEAVTSAKIVLTQDVTLDATAVNEEDMYVLRSALCFYGTSVESTFEIDAAGYTLTILNDRGPCIETMGNVTFSNGTFYNDGYNSRIPEIYAAGNAIISDATVYAENYGIQVTDAIDYFTGEWYGGNLKIENSDVFALFTYNEDEYGNVEYGNGISVYNALEIIDSYVESSGTGVGIYAYDATINNSMVSAYGVDAGIMTERFLNINNSSVMAMGDYVAVAAGYGYYEEDVVADALTVNGVTFIDPQVVNTEIATVFDSYGDEYYANTFVDAEGNALVGVYMEAANSATYEIINGKLIITVVTEGRMNRIALYDADGKCIKTFNSYEVDENGNFVWTIKMDAPTVETDYIIKARDAETNSYKNGATLPAITVEPEVVIESVEVQTRGDKVYVIATTVSDNYDRIAIVNPVDSSYVKYTRNYEYDYENDRYVWTIFFDYALVEGMDNLLVKARDIRNNRYNNAQAVEITVDAPVEPVIDVTITDYDEENILVTVTTVPDLYRVKISFADDAASSIKYAKAPATTSDDAWTWEMVIARPTETTEFAIDVAYVKAYARYYTYVTYEVGSDDNTDVPGDVEIPGDNNDNTEIPGDNNDNTDIPGDNNDNTDIPGDNNDNTDIPGDNNDNTDIPGDNNDNTDIPGDDNTGDDNTGDDNTGDDNTGDDNTGDNTETPDVEEPADDVAPAKSLWNKVTNKTYVFEDGKVSMYVGNWVYYGFYGLTLVARANTTPIDAAAIEIYEAESDEVFAKKTASDFQSVLGERVTKFEQVTVDGEYLGYIAYTSSYRCLVFQANGYKYFINYMPVVDWFGVDGEKAFLEAVESIVVYEA